MCGIAGEVLFEKSNKQLEIKKLQDALKHRGPDGDGNYHKGNVSLGMRRLAIIDVKGGDQPLFNEDKSIAIVGNGEIYNYVELQKELKKKGHKLRTGSDIETIAHLYEDYGLTCVNKLRGMFALALHDRKANKVILWRDRMGEKPLYYSKLKDKIVFSSEMKSLLKIKGIDKTLNLTAIDEYFHYYFITEPKTMFTNVKKLPAGFMLIIDMNNNTIEERQYWFPSLIKPKNKSNPVKNIKSIFSEACMLTLRSDVPVGIALSGGIDSGAILALCAPKYKKSMKAFSIGYEGQPESDERQMARDLSDQYGVEFFQTEIKASEMVSFFPQLVWHSDDPIADIASYSIYRVSKLARENKVPVILGGLGGDELFWGYPSTVQAMRTNLDLLSWKRIISKDFMYNNPNPKIAGRFIENLYSSSFKDSLPKEIKGHKKFSSAVDIAKHQLDTLREKWLISNCVALSDRLSMASSIELRSPFLDYKLVETVLSSIPAIKAYELPAKYWFKKAMKNILPEEVLNRPKKGFTPPVGKWLEGLIKEYLPLLKNGFLVENNILEKNKVQLLTKTWRALPMNWYSLYQMVLLEIWGREFVWNINPKKI